MSNQHHLQTHSAPPPFYASPTQDQMMAAIPLASPADAGVAGAPLQIGTSLASNPTSSGVVLPSSYRTKYLLATYLLPLLVTISMAGTAGYYLVFLAPAVVVITVLIGLSAWIGTQNINDFGVDASGQPTMTKTQLIHIIIARFTLGFWVLGAIMLLLLGLESTIIAFITDESTAWYFIGFMCYIFAWQFWFLVYLFTVYRSAAGVPTAAEVKLICVSTQAVALGCTVFQLWSGFVIFAYNINLFGDITGFDIPVQVSTLMMVVATLITVTLIPIDVCGAEYLVLHVRLRACRSARLAAHGGIGLHPSLHRGSDRMALVLPVLLRGSLLIILFLCVFAILTGAGSYASAVSVYLFIACLVIVPFNIHVTRRHLWLNTLINHPQLISQLVRAIQGRVDEI